MESTPKFVLAKDRWESMARQNYWDSLHQTIPSPEFADSGIKLSNIVKNLVQKGGGLASYPIEQIEKDMDLADIREEIAISCVTPNGWNAPLTGVEQINIDVVSDGISLDIRVELFGEELFGGIDG